MEDTLSILRILTANLPPIPTLKEFKLELFDSNDISQKHVVYDVEGGVCHSYSLFSSPEISVARTFISEGSIFPEHLHEETEYILIFSGSALIRVDGKEKILRPGKCTVHEPNVPHWAKALEDTWFIAISIPYSKDYPE